MYIDWSKCTTTKHIIYTCSTQYAHIVNTYIHHVHTQYTVTIYNIQQIHITTLYLLPVAHDLVAGRVQQPLLSPVY